VSDLPGRDRLYQLLPAIFRIRDAEQGRPLQALIEAIQVQADAVAGDIARQYDNWFIETCDDQLVPYFADLVGLDLGPSAPADTDGAGAALDARSRRRQVANAIADRRRKGTFSVLEQLAADATGWPALAVELDRVVLATQSVRLPDVGRRALPDIRDAAALEAIGTPFAAAAPLPDVRRPASARTPGGPTPRSVAVWLWRLVADQVQRAPATPIGDDARYTFDQLGRDLCLVVQPPGPGPSTPATALDVPTPITRRALELRIEDYYGPAGSICVYRGREPVPRAEIMIDDLGGRHAATKPGHVTIDPERGRIAFPAGEAPEDDGVYVTYSRLAIGGIGGGSYERPLAREPHVYRVAARTVGAYRTVGAAVKAWREAGRKRPQRAATIEIADDNVYEERFELELAPGETLEIRAAEGRRPVLLPIESPGNRPDRFRILGRGPADPDEARERAPVLVLDGLWIARHPLELDGRLGAVTLRHCTLVPAGALRRPGLDEDRYGASLIVRANPCPITIVSSVLGRIRVETREAGRDPLPMSVTSSVLDASDLDGRAVLGIDERPAWVSLSLQRVTVLGGAHVHGIELVEDSILTAALDCERRQQGEVRYSFVAPGSRTPRRTGCLQRPGAHFDSVAFGAAAYARLAADMDQAIAQGAHDGGELGAYHDMWQARRVRDLRTRLQEFTPPGAEIDIRFAS
jgi:hypothetical protein